jgi:serine/threonine protein kinase
LQKLGKYEILAELGRGAMGVVYKARDPLIGRLVALKTINSSLVDRPDLLERFYQEAQSAGKLQHPNIVTIFELGKAEETPYIAMEYLDGESLEKYIFKQVDLSLALKVGYIVRICQALEYAHKNRVVHRDVKPGNIMVNSDGIVKVVDFGIARLIDFSRTHTNMMIGTPAYMAPELLRKKKADARSDIWAVGVTFYELVCYQRPFTGEGYDIFHSILEDEFPPCSSLVADCPREIDMVVQRMLRKASADRYQTMEEVLLDLEPVWNPLRFLAASALIDRANEFYDRGNLAMAQETLRQARQIDSSNTRAKTLLEKVSADLRQTDILPKLEAHLTRGRAFIQSRQFREAQAEAEAALELDSRSEPAKELAAEAGLAAAQAKVQREFQQRIQEIRTKIERQELTDAIDLANQTLTTLGPNMHVTRLLQAAQVELEQRNKKQAQKKAQGDMLPDTRPFSPTDIQQKPFSLDAATEVVSPPPFSAGPIGISTHGEPAKAMANSSPRVRPAVPVLTPPPLPQTQAPVIKAQNRIEKPVQEIPAPHRFWDLPKKLTALGALLILLIVTGVTYRYITVSRQKTQPPPTLEVVANNPPETKAAPNMPTASVEPGSPPEGTAADNSLGQAVAAYNRRDFAAAKPALDRALSLSLPNWPKRAQATDFLKKTQTRLLQEQHLKQAQNFFTAKNFDAARSEANQTISAPDGDPIFKNDASKLIASIPVPPNAAVDKPAKSPEPLPKDFTQVSSSITAALNLGQWDDAEAKLNTLPSDQPEYANFKQRIVDGREDQAFAQKKGELAQAETSKNESALRISKDYFDGVAGREGRHSTEARSLATQIDLDLKNIATANSALATKSPASPIAPVRDDAADILAVLKRFADAVSKGDIEQVKSVRNLSTTEEKKLRDTFQQAPGHVIPTTLNNCLAPQISGDSAAVTCTVVSGKNDPRKATFSLSRTGSGQWRIVSNN